MSDETESDAKPSANESGTIRAVRGWLEQQGYPLEMRVARVFHDAGADVVQSEYYVSPEGKSREIDVGARLMETWDVTPVPKGFIGPETPATMFFDLFVVAECKSGPKSKKPWVVFTSNRNLMLSTTRFQRLGSPLGKRFLNAMAKRDSMQEVDVFKVSERCGYALACAFWKPDAQDETKDEAKDDTTKKAKAKKPDPPRGDDPGFAALASLASAARAKTYVDTSSNPALRVCRIVLPLLIVDTPIVECWLDENGDTQLRECDQVTIVWRNPIGGDQVVIIEVMHESALPRFVKLFHADFAWLSYLKTDMELAQASIEAEARNFSTTTNAKNLPPLEE